MKRPLIIVFFLNALGGMGYSLIAPLFPPLCKERGISNETCSLIIAIISVTEMLTAFFCPILTKKFGQTRMMLIGLLGQTAAVFFYGFMVFIPSNFLFLTAAFANRLFQGFCNSLVNIISFSIIALLTTSQEEIEVAMGYMELSWGLGLTVGPGVIGLFFDLGGYCLPYIIIGCITYSGYYFFNTIPQEELMSKSRKVSNADDEKKTRISNGSKHDTPIINIILYPTTLLLMGCILIQLNTTCFYLATLVNYLKDSFSIQTSRASLFFLGQTIGYIICTRVINKFTSFFGNFGLITFGHFCAVFCCLLTAPAGFLPHYYMLVAIGIFLQGFVAGIVNIPTFIELLNVGKLLLPNDHQMQRDLPSSLLNFSFYFGELVEPIIGSCITGMFYFQMSAYFAAVLSFIYAFVFGCYFQDKIKEFFSKDKEISIKLIDQKISSIKIDC